MARPASTASVALLRLVPTLPARAHLPLQKIPGIPFFRDERHTIPTRALYRHLLRLTSPLNDLGGLRRDIREGWQRRRGMTSIPQTRSFLESQYALLHTPSQALVELSSALFEKQSQADTRLALLLRTRKQSQLRPYVAGFLRPSPNNPPLPQLKPQPVQISLMIKSRVAARQRRVYQQKRYWVEEEGIRAEIAFCRRAHYREGLEEAKLFLADLRERQKQLQVLFDRDEARKRGVYTVGMVRRVDKAKRQRQAWKRTRAEARKAQGKEGDGGC